MKNILKPGKMNYLKSFIEDCKYYDKENKELNSIIKYANIKNKTILDIGTGIGRLSFPLSKYAKEVTALDSDKRLAPYFKKHKKGNVKFINQKAENFLKQNKNFDIILLAWPTFNFKFINSIKKTMNKNSLFIFITFDNNSDYETIINNLEPKKSFDKEVKNKKKFLSLLNKNFKIILKKKINTKYIYLDKNIAFKVIKNSMKLWFNIKFNKEKENILKEIIKEHKKDNKVIFGEKIWFYIMKK